MTADLQEASAALRSQWDHLDAWLRALGPDLDDLAGRPSGVDGWSLGELLSHLGRALETLAIAGPVPPGTVPLTFAEYLGTYPERAAEIDDATRALDRRLAPDRLGGVEDLARTALRRLDDLQGQRVVQARRGPITLRDMVVSRVVELVVHADDLHRSLPGVVDDPVEPAALDLVADELLHVVVVRGGWSLDVADARLWVRLATGREPYDVDRLARALEPRYTSDAVPDLGRVLPLL